MKKFNDANVGLFVLLTACLSLFSCNNDNDNYPKDYVGFEKSTRTVECDKNQSESELPVSYTHLDVYKRQTLFCPNEVLFSVSAFLSASEISSTNQRIVSAYSTSLET